MTSAVTAEFAGEWADDYDFEAAEISFALPLPPTLILPATSLPPTLALPVSVLPATPPEPALPPSRAARVFRLGRRLLPFALPFAVLIVLALGYRHTTADLSELESANPAWVLVAGLCAAGVYLAGTACQQGTVLTRLPTLRLLAVQFGAAAASAVGVAHVGGAYVNVRFLCRAGLTRTRALLAVSVNSAANAVMHALLLIVLLVVLPDGTVPSARIPDVLLGMGIVVVIAVILAALWLLPGGRLGRLRSSTRELVAELLAVFRHPVRASQLWGGALATIVLHAAALYCVLHALGVDAAPGRVLLAYVAASAASAPLPSPGALGALDIALSLALSGVTRDASTAVTAVLLYRLVTAWLPLVPSALTLGLLARRGVV